MDNFECDNKGPFDFKSIFSVGEIKMDFSSWLQGSIWPQKHQKKGGGYYCLKTNLKKIGGKNCQIKKLEKKKWG